MKVSQFGDTPLPKAQQKALRSAKRLQVISIVYMATGLALVASVMGSSQAMKAAWIEDCLGLLPPIAFLVATRFIRRPRSRGHPYGHHRAIGVAHLVAALALLGMGSYLAVSSALGLIRVERPPVGLTVLLGQPIWAGWLMIAAMVYTGVGPVILGRMKLPLSEELHDKVLYADADMNAADWKTAAAAIVGILGIGVGWWWADAVAALVIAFSILRDGVQQISQALRDLMDGEARTHDDERTHPLVGAILTAARGTAWVADAAARVRDQGHLFHVEVFVVPTATVAVADLEALAARISELDWKLHDVVVAPVSRLPDAVRSTPASG